MQGAATAFAVKALGAGFAFALNVLLAWEMAWRKSKDLTLGATKNSKR